MDRNEAITKLQSHANSVRDMGATSLYLFGSTVRNEAKTSSDLDLFIDYDPAKRFSLLDLVSIKQFLEEKLVVEIDVTTRSTFIPCCERTSSNRQSAFSDGEAQDSAGSDRNSRGRRRYSETYG